MTTVTVVFATGSFSDRCVAVLNDAAEFAVFRAAATAMFGGTGSFDLFLRGCVQHAAKDLPKGGVIRRRAGITVTVWALLLPQPPASVPDPANRLGDLIGGGCAEITVTVSDLNRLDDYRVEVTEIEDRHLGEGGTCYGG